MDHIKNQQPISLESRAETATEVTTFGLVINALLMTIKFVAGFLGNSQAMIADAAHTLSDFATDAAVLVAVRFSRKPKDSDHAYGHGKYETIAALLIGFTLLYVGVNMGIAATRSIANTLNGTAPVRPSAIAFWAAVVSIAAKEFLFRKTIAVGKRIGNEAVVANAWHHRSDAFSSIGTAVGIGLASFLGGKWSVLDPTAALIVSALLIKVSWCIMRRQIGSLSDSSLPEDVNKEIIGMALAFPDISRPHNLRTRMVGGVVVIDLHVRVNPEMRVADAHALVSQLESAFRRRFGEDTIATVHIEPVKPEPAYGHAPGADKN